MTILTIVFPGSSRCFITQHLVLDRVLLIFHPLQFPCMVSWSLAECVQGWGLPHSPRSLTKFLLMWKQTGCLQLPLFLPMTVLCSFWHICVHALATLHPSLALPHDERFQGPSLVHCIISSVSTTALSQDAGDDGVSLVEAPPAEGTRRCPAQPGLGARESVLRGGGS